MVRAIPRGLTYEGYLVAVDINPLNRFGRKPFSIDAIFTVPILP